MTTKRLLTGLSLIVGAQFLSPPSAFVASLQPERAKDTLTSKGLSAQAVPSDALTAIKERGYITVAVKDNRPPLGFVDDAGELAGFEIEIARQLAASLLGSADAVKFVPLSNVERLSAVIDGDVDVAIAAITLTEPRRRLVSFSDPYYLDGTAFVVRPGVSVTDPLLLAPATPEGLLEQSKIAILDRSSSVPHVRYLLPGAQLIGVSSYQQGQSLLISGEVDAFAADASVLAGWVRPEGPLAGYQMLSKVISAEPLAIALPKGQQYDTLQREINRTLRRWYAEGWLQTQAEYWRLP